MEADRETVLALGGRGDGVDSVPGGPQLGAGRVHGLIGEDYQGRLISNRYPAYGWLPRERRQVCWTHLRRAFQAKADGVRPGRGLALRLVAVMAEVFHPWHQARDHPDLREWLNERVAPFQQGCVGCSS